MPTRIVLSLIAAVGLCTGCASADLADNGASAHAEKQYRTGSNIPRRPDQMPDRVETATVSSSDNTLGHTSVPLPGAGGH
jgi:hypothetical protein